MYKYQYLNNRFVHESEALLPVNDIGVTRGYGIFDFFQIHAGVPIYMSEHLQRFIYSCEKMRLNIQRDASNLEEIIFQSMKINRITNAAIKMVVTGGVSPNGFDIAMPNLAVLALPYAMISEDLVENGTNLISYEHVRALPEIKTTNYSMAIYLSPQVKANKAIEPLYYTQSSVSECSRSNIFGVKGSTIVTPEKNILLGISRKRVLQIAEENNYKLEVRDMTLAELKAMDEVFLTGTTKKVLPVVKIDQDIIANGKRGPATLELQLKFDQQEDQLIHRSIKDTILG